MQLAMCNAECGMRNAECGMQNAECGMQNAECGMQTVPKVADWNPSVTRYYVPCDTVSPAGSVGASASQRSPPETRVFDSQISQKRPKTHCLSQNSCQIFRFKV